MKIKDYKRKYRRGVLMMDLMIATSLAVLFIGLLANNSITAEQIYEQAKYRLSLIKAYGANEELFSNLLPYQSTVSSTSSMFGRWYGNDLVERVMNISSSSMSFTKINFPVLSKSVYAGGEALCPPDLINRHVIGSYQDLVQKSIPNQAAPNASNLLPENINISSTPILLPIGAQSIPTDLEIRNNIAYISLDSPSSPDSDFTIIDIKDINNVKTLSNLNTGPGLTSFTIAGPRIFASAPSTVYQLHIIYLNNLANPVLENRYKLALPYATATPALGSAIAYDRGLVFLGTEKWDGQEFNVIDVSDVQNPQKIGGIEIGSKVNNILIRGNYAYVTASNHKQLSVIELTELGPNLIKIFEPSGWERQEGRSLSFFEDHLDLGRTSGGFDLVNDHELFVFATTSSTTLNTFISSNNSGGIYGILRDRSYLYLATRQLDKEFQIVSLNDPAERVNFALPIAPKIMTCDSGSIYIMANESPFIYKIDLTIKTS